MAEKDKDQILKEIAEAKDKLATLEKLLEKESLKEEEKKDVEDKDKEDAKSIVATLDEIANSLEEEGTPECLKLAFEIDKISDQLEGKISSALKYDKDEPYMEKYFRGGVREKDKDEDYLKEFNTDVSNEVRKMYEKSKEASLPYEII